MLPITFIVELERKEDGRRLAEVLELPGVLTYGQFPEEATAKAQALALHVLPDGFEYGDAHRLLSISFKAA